MRTPDTKSKGVTVPHLPVIVGFGGISAAGRSSFHHGYQRMIIDSLDKSEQQKTLLGLATLMGLLKYENGHYQDSQGKSCRPDEVESRFKQQILQNTLLRKINAEHFDVDNVALNTKMTVRNRDGADICFTAEKRELPKRLPDNWIIADLEAGADQQVQVTIKGGMEFLAPDFKESQVKTAGQLPTGFDPAKFYHSNHHPRGLQMSVFSAWDAIHSLGIEWDTIRQAVHPDQIGVYAGSGHGQMDDNGGGGLMKALVTGKRTSSRYLPLSLVDMPSNFINAYIIGNIGHTGTQIAACATFLYNLELAIKEIQRGRRRVAIVGNAEAPILPEIIDGYRAMGALADDARLLSYSKTGTITHEDRARSCRPFGDNFGFTLSESAQFIILFDDALVLELGAQVHGSVADVFIKADGFKKSISSPGVGNLITLAKAAARQRAILGEKSLQTGSFVLAHGSGTPLNRATESQGLNETARAFNIKQWQIAAIKCYLGHPLTPASGDQLMTALGTWKYGWIPGIFTLDSIPDDVQRSHLAFSQTHVQIDPQKLDAAFINSKGFGGNNATGLAFSPHVTLKMLRQKHGEKALAYYLEKNRQVVEKAESYDQAAIKGLYNVLYKDSEPVLKEGDLRLTDQQLTIPGYDKPIDLNLENLFPDMTPFT
jgi:acetoacetyl-[acyl-carrier protein] synthase